MPDLQSALKSAVEVDKSLKLRSLTERTWNFLRENPNSGAKMVSYRLKVDPGPVRKALWELTSRNMAVKHRLKGRGNSTWSALPIRGGEYELLPRPPVAKTVEQAAQKPSTVADKPVARPFASGQNLPDLEDIEALTIAQARELWVKSGEIHRKLSELFGDTQ